MRRERLMEVGLDLLGGPVPGAVAVRAVCRRAHLTERYFYESFPDRDALVVAVHDEVADEARRVLERATRSSPDKAVIARRAIEAMVQLVVDDPRKGRVLLVAPITEPALAGRGLELVALIARMIRDHLPAGIEPHDRSMISTGVLAALMGLFYGYLQGSLRVTRAQFVDHCVRVLVTCERLARDPQPQPG